MLEDEVVLLIERGHPPQFVMRLDLVSFWALSESSHRVNATKRLDEFYNQRIASNGTGEAVKGWIKELEDDVGVTPDEKSNDVQRFLNDIQNGFRKRKKA